jgi:hypothetical protein
MVGRFTRVSMAAAVGMAAAGAVAGLAPPEPAHAAGRYRAESGYDSSSPKSVVATCPPGEVAIGGGARIKGGGGGVRLAALVPTGTSVEATGDALPAQDGEWSVVAVAVCVPATMTTPTVVASPSGSRTATCPGDTVLSGTGFDLPAGVPLTGLVPDADGGAVTVQTAFQPFGGTGPVAYAVCVPGLRVSASAEGPRYRRWQKTSPSSGSARKVVVVRQDGPWEFPSMSGAGADVTMAAGGPGLPVVASAFIDAIVPSADGSTVTVEAVRRPVTTAAPAIRGTGPGAAPVPLPVPTGDDDDDWSVIGYAVDHDIY